MFSQLGALAAKSKTAASKKPAPKVSASTVAEKTKQEEELPLRREREEVQDKNNSENDDNEHEEEVFQSSSAYQNKYANLTPQQEKELVQELRNKILDLEKDLALKISKKDEKEGEGIMMIREDSTASTTSTATTTFGNSSTSNEKTNNNDNKTTPESRKKDDIVLTWVELELTRWHFDLLARKRQTDPTEIEAVDKCIEILKKFVDNTLEEISPMIDGLKNHLLPIELTIALFNAFSACHIDRRFNEAENIYFQYLLGNSNWHLGVFTMLHQRAAHDSFLRGNIKSKLHNHELRKMMVVFKELMNREQVRFEEEERKKKALGV